MQNSILLGHSRECDVAHMNRLESLRNLSQIGSSATDSAYGYVLISTSYSCAYVFLFSFRKSCSAIANLLPILVSRAAHSPDLKARYAWSA